MQYLNSCGEEEVPSDECFDCYISTYASLVCRK